MVSLCPLWRLDTKGWAPAKKRGVLCCFIGLSCMVLVFVCALLSSFNECGVCPCLQLGNRCLCRRNPLPPQFCLFFSPSIRGSLKNPRLLDYPFLFAFGGHVVSSVLLDGPVRMVFPWQPLEEVPRVSIHRRGSRWCCGGGFLERTPTPTPSPTPPF